MCLAYPRVDLRRRGPISEVVIWHFTNVPFFFQGLIDVVESWKGIRGQRDESNSKLFWWILLDTHDSSESKVYFPYFFLHPGNFVSCKLRNEPPKMRSWGKKCVIILTFGRFAPLTDDYLLISQANRIQMSPRVSDVSQMETKLPNLASGQDESCTGTFGG